MLSSWLVSNASNLGVIRDTSIFLAVRKHHPQHRLMVREGCAAGAMPAPSTHQSPFLQAAFPAALFYARRTVKSETSNSAGRNAPTSDLG